MGCGQTQCLRLNCIMNTSWCTLHGADISSVDISYIYKLNKYINVIIYDICINTIIAYDTDTVNHITHIIEYIEIFYTCCKKNNHVLNTS